MLDPDDLVGFELDGRYRIEAPRAGGPAGERFSGIELETALPVEITVFDGVPEPGPRYDREARRVAGLDSPYLARLYAALRLGDGTPVLVHEASEGETLAERAERGPLRLVDALDVLDQVLQGLHVAHARGVVHRDLKPTDVHVVDGPGGRPQARLHHAGFAQILSDASAPAMGDLLYGHPQFTAPEQWVNRPVDGRTDLYALGLVASALLSGQPIIEPGPPLEVCRRHFKAVRPVLEETCGGESVPRGFAYALTRAMHPEPRFRFESAEEMRKAVRDALSVVRPRPLVSLRSLDADASVTLSDADETAGGTLERHASLNMSVAELQALVASVDVFPDDDEDLEDTLIDGPPEP